MRAASAILACLAAAAAGCAHAPSAVAPAAVAATTGAVLAQPMPGVYASGQPAAVGWPAIAARGVRTVINLRTPEETPGRDEAAEVRAAGMAYRALPVPGAGGIDADHAHALSVLLREAGGPVLLHCASGNRAGGLLAVSAAQDGMPAPDALALGRAAGMTSTESRVRDVIGSPGD